MSLPSVRTVMASNTESGPSESEHLEERGEKQCPGLEEARRQEIFFTQTEVLLSVETKLELQDKLKR